MRELREEIGGRKIYNTVSIPLLSREMAPLIAGNAGDAGILVLTGESLIREEDSELGGPAAGRRILLLGPSTEGVASLLTLPHWCPYGR
jgi:hypothetical protein